MCVCVEDDVVEERKEKKRKERMDKEWPYIYTRRGGLEGETIGMNVFVEQGCYC